MAGQDCQFLAAWVLMGLMVALPAVSAFVRLLSLPSASWIAPQSHSPSIQSQPHVAGCLGRLRRRGPKP